MKRTPLQRKTPLRPKSFASSLGSSSTGPSRVGLRPGKGFAASPAQRKKAREEPCVVSQQEALYGATIDPAHLVSRAQGGCDDPLCVVPLRRDLHREFDEGRLDLLPYLVGKRVPELCHALEHLDGSPTQLLHRLTGERFAPVRIVHGDDLDADQKM